MDVGSHPHIGLQTVSWLLDGEIVHFDSLGNECLLKAGGVNVMTAGRAIAHAEQTPTQNNGRLNGVQLWTALPDSNRHDAASFQHIPSVPTLVLPGGIARVFSGSLDSYVSPATHFSDLIGADIDVHGGEALNIPLIAGREHAFILLSGEASFEGQPLIAHTLYYVEPGRTDTSFTSSEGARVLLVGGAPFKETILMWWNFVARTADEIREARTAWQERRLFDEVRGYAGGRIPAPELMRLAEPNPMS